MVRKRIIPFFILLFSFCILQGTAAFASSKHLSPAPGIYELSCATDPGFVLDVHNCIHSFEISSSLQIFRSVNVNQQKYYLEQLPGGFYRLSNLFTAETLTAGKVPENTQSEEASTEVFLDTLERSAGAAASADQSWSLEPSNDGCIYIRSRENGLYLTRESGTIYNGATVFLSEFAGEQNQQWLLTKAWISTQGEADTDLVNPYAEDGKYHNFKMALRFGMDRPVLTADQVADWMTENDDHQLVLNQTALTDYVQKLADQYDTQGYPRKFQTSYGKVITLYKGNFGWKLDVEKTVQEIQNHLGRSGTFVIDPIWSHKGVSFTRGDDIGNSYVEVDLVSQKVWLYKKGKKLLESDCVTGTYGTDRQTPGGVYSIYYLQSPAVLRGADYASPVDYWMPFNGSIGLHDANWRSTFGGEIFKTNGSHGCINLPVDIAKQIYEIVEIGYPVVCYN